MEFKLKQIEIDNFYSFKDEKITNIKNYNVLIGKNNVGKSNLFKVIQILIDNYNGKNIKPSNLFDEDQNKDAKISLVFELSLNYRKEFFNALNEPNYFIGVFRTDNKPKRMFEAFNKEVLKYLIKEPFLSAIKITFMYSSIKKIIFLKEIAIINQNINNPKPIFLTHLLENDLRINFINPGRLINAPTFKDFFNLEVEIDRGAPYQSQNLSSIAHHLRANHPFRDNLFLKKIVDDILNRFSNIFVLIPADRKFQDSFRTEGADTTPLAQNGENIAQLIFFYENDRKGWMTELNQTLKQFFPNLENLSQSFKVNETIPHYKEDGLNLKINYSNKGSAIMHLAFILIRLKQLKKNQILLIEEPELFMFPGLQKKLMKKFLEMSEKNQIFITSHSPNFLSRNLEKCMIYQVQKEVFLSKFKNISENDLFEVFREIELGPFDYLMCEGIIFVEGQRDIDVYEELFKFVFDSKLQIVEMYGKKNARHYKDARILEYLSNIPVNYVIILDRDTDTPTDLNGNIIKTPLYELENLFLQPILLIDYLYQEKKKNFDFKKHCQWIIKEINELFKDLNSRNEFILKKFNEDFRFGLSTIKVNEIINESNIEWNMNQLIDYYVSKLREIIERKKHFKFFKDIKIDLLKTELQKVAEFYEIKYRAREYNEIIPGKKIFNRLIDIIQREFGLKITRRNLILNLINFFIEYYKSYPKKEITKIDKDSSIKDLGGIVSHIKDTNINCLEDNVLREFKTYCGNMLLMIKNIKKTLGCKLNDELLIIQEREFGLIDIKDFLILRWGLGQKLN